MANPSFDEFFDQRQEESRRLRSTLTVVGDTTPDIAAKQQQLSKFTGLPLSVVQTDEGYAKGVARLNELTTTSKSSPVLRAWLEKPDFMAVAQDDTGILSSMEQGVGGMVSYLMGNGPGQGVIGTIKSAPYKFAYGATGVKKAVVDLLGAGETRDDQFWSKLSQQYGQQAAAFDANDKATDPLRQGILAGGAQSGVGSLLQSSKYLPLALTGPVGAGAALIGMASETFGTSYNKASEENMSLFPRLGYAASNAVIEWATEKGPLGALVHDIKVGSPLAVTMVKNAWKENKGEQVATVLQDLNDWAAIDSNKGKTFVDYLKERPEAAAKTAVATMFGSAGNVALGESIQGVLDKTSDMSRESYLKEQTRLASERSDNFVKGLVDLQKTMESSKLLERSPDTLRTFAQGLMDSEGVSQFYVDTAKLVEAGVNLDELAQVLPSLQPQLEAAKMGVDLVIPAGELLTDTIGTVYGQPLMDNLRPAEDGMSRVEAQAWMDSHGNEIKAEVDRALQEKEADATFNQSKATVQQQVLDGLNGLGRFSPKQNEKLASLASTMYAVTAAQMGVTPEALAKEFDLGFTDRQLVGEEKKLAQATRAKPYGKQIFADVILNMGLSDQETNSTVLEYMTGQAKDQAFVAPVFTGIPEVVQFLHKRRLESGLPVLDIKVDADREQLAKLISAEALAAIQNAGDSLQWYDKTIGALIAQMAVKYPELETDPKARNALILATAIGSQGMNVETNLTFAQEQYAEFRKTGKFPEIGKGESSAAMASSFKLANKLIAEKGHEQFIEFLRTSYTVKQLTDLGYEIGGEKMDEMVLGSSIFGPKIGFGFYTNLTGNFEPVTMDMWFMRTIGRLSGTLPAFNQEKFDKQIARFREGLKAKGKASTGIFSSQFDKDLVKQAKTDLDAAMKLARLVKSAHEKDFKNNRADYDSGKRTKSEMVAAADTMILSMDKPRDVPGSGGERQLLRDVVRRVVAKVEQQYGQRIPPAALQALIWYPEQELWSALGVKLAVTSQDYAGAAKKILLKDGIDEQRLDAAIRSVVGTGPVQQVSGGANRPEDSGVGGQDGQANGRNLAQDNRGQIGFPQHGLRSGKTLIAVLETADLSTIPHELGHFFWEMRFDLAAQMEEKLATGGQLTDGEQQILNDVNKGLTWAGVEAAKGMTLLQTWFAMTDEEVEPYHEKFARGLEAYLMEGTSPNLEMRNLFQTFRAWLIGVYKSILKSEASSNTEIGEAMDVKLTDEFRQVMDRMLATAEEIEVAEAARSMGALFKTSEEGGMDMGAYQLYHSLGLQHTKDAIDYLQAASLRDLQWLQNAQSKGLKAMQKKHDALRKGIEEEVTAQVMAEPAMKAKVMLDEARKLVGQDTPEFDIALQSAAEANGFPTVDEMLRSIKEFGDPKDSIAGMTDKRMLEENGEIATEDGMKTEVNRAIHNDARARFVATELRALQHAMSVRSKVPGQRATVDVLTEAAKEFSADIIGKLPINMIKPLQYVQAAARNGKAAERATGDLEKQVEYKRNQLINTVAAKTAYDAKAEVAKMEALFKKVATAKDTDNRDMDIVNAARAVVAAFGYGSEKKGLKALEYLDKVKAYDPDLYEVLRQSVDAATGMAKPGRELTLEEMRAVFNEVDALWFKSKRLRQMEIDGEMMDRAELAEELAAELALRPAPAAPGVTSAPTEADQRRIGFSSAKAALRRVESWVDGMDGGKMGVFRKYIWQPVKEAADRYRTQRAIYVKRLRDGFDNIAPTFGNKTYYSKHLNYTFGKDSGGVAMNEIMHAILHSGNESNLRKLLLGRGWATELTDGSLDTSRWDAFLLELADTGVLTKDHMDWAQSVWDLLEELKPGAQKAHRDAYGKYFDEITANSLTIPGGETWGAYRGGYVPAMADSRIVKDQELKKLIEAGTESMSYAFPGTSKGFTKGRVEYNRPLLLDLRTLAQHIDKVLLFTHMENPVRDVSRLLSSNKVAEPLNNLDPGAINHMLVPWLTRSAQQRVSTPITGMGWANRFLNGLRNRSSMATMFANISNTAQQITGFSLAGVKVPPRLLLQATADYLKSPKKMTAVVAASSEYMTHRMDEEANAMLGDIEAILLDANLYEKSQEWAKRHTYFMQSAVDNVMGPIIWMGAFNHNIEQGLSDKDAARMADAAVRQTQGSSLAEDVSRIETGSPVIRLFTQFAGYFNMQANLLGTEFGTLSREVGLRKGMGKGLMILTLGFLIPAILAEAIALAFKGGPGDEDKDGEYLDDWIMAVFGFSLLKNATAFVPGVGQVINTAVARFNHNPADDKMSLSPAVSMIESAASVPHDLYKIVIGEANAQKTVRDLATLITLTTGLPASAAARSLGYMSGEAQGKIEPTSTADQVRGLLTGVASPDSKVK